MARFYFNPALRHLAGRSARVDGGLRRVEKGLLRLVWGATSGLGLERASALGAALGGLFGPRSRKYRHARESLMRAFPERDPAWIEARARGVWRQIGRVLAEYPHIGELADPMNGRIRFESAVDMDEVRRSPVGWVFLAMHQANWNLPGVAGALAGFPLDVVYRAQPDPELEAMVEGYRNLINPTGNFVVGGPQGDSGLTGRKIIVDTYGGMGRHGGGAFSGKDPSKVDRSAAYMGRWVAKNIVAAGLADKCEIQFAYAIGHPLPVSVHVDTFGTGTASDEAILAAVLKVFSFKPADIVKQLNLLRPIYSKSTNYGHFGKDDADLTWEATNKAAALKKAVK